MMNNTQYDHRFFLTKKDNLLKEINYIFANKNNITKNYIKVRSEIELAQKRIELEPELKVFLEKFQRKEQEKLVGINQSLLTAILQDVMKNDDEERKVIMDIFTERGLPALSIFIEKNEQGVLEDVYNGTGGAVANILSLGLRAIALIQSKKRRFLVLDEPDCWIKPEIIPDFVQVIKQLSEKLKIQILIISHHDESLLNEINHRLILEKKNGKLNTRWSNQYGCTQPEWNEEDEGIRSVYLENFQSHDSTLIPLAKTVTLLTGLNDLGKSTIVNALRAVFYGLGDDTNIKHFENEAKVSIDFGKFALFWERKLKGKPKETFILIDENHDFSNPLHKTESAREVPTWLEEETGIGLIDGFDIQLGHQKKPIFLLDEPASRKAKALSIGDESNYVQTMINISKEDLSQARQIVKQGEKSLERDYKKLRIYEKYKDEFEHIENIIKNNFENIFNIIEENQKLKQKLEEIKKTKEEKDKIDLLIKTIKMLSDNKKEANSLNLEDNSFILSLNKEINDFNNFIITFNHFNQLKKELELFNKHFSNTNNNWKIEESLLDPSIKIIELQKEAMLIKKYLTSLREKEIFNKYFQKSKNIEFNVGLLNKVLRLNNLIEILSRIPIDDLIKEKKSIEIIEKIKNTNNFIKKTIENYNIKNVNFNEIDVFINNFNLIKENESGVKDCEQNKKDLEKESKIIQKEFKNFKQCPLCLQAIEHQH